MSQSPVSYNIGLRTDVGQQRSLNEDAAETFDLPGADAAFVVCDGMGGLRAGDIASREAVRVVRETLQERFAAAASGTQADPFAALGEAFRRANDAVNNLHSGEDATVTAEIPGAGNSPSRRQAEEGGTTGLMGTTCVAGIVRGQTLFLAHAGDSRAYLLRSGQLAPITNDHSFVAERVRAGDMTESEARISKFRNMITRAIGIDTTVEPEMRREPLAPGDTVLVCSDGLTTMLEDQDIAALLNGPQGIRTAPEKAASVLVDAANKKGGSDNITVLLLKVQGDMSNHTQSGKVLDMDDPSPRRQRREPRGRSGSPLPWLLLGALLLAALTAIALFAVPGARRGAMALLSSGGTDGSLTVTNGGSNAKTSGGPGRSDFTKLIYSQPQLFSNFQARGDLLSYSPGEGLYFVAPASGKVACLSRTGEVLRTVEQLEIVDSTKTTTSPTRVFMTSDMQGNVYISYTKRRTIEKKDASGRLLARLSGFVQPEAIAVDEDGNLYVVDFNQVKILRAKTGTPPAAKPSAAPASSGSSSPKPRATAGA